MLIVCDVCVMCVVCVTSHCLYTQDVFRLLLTVVEARYEAQYYCVCNYAWHVQCYVHGIERLLMLVDVVVTVK